MLSCAEFTRRCSCPWSRRRTAPNPGYRTGPPCLPSSRRRRSPRPPRTPDSAASVTASRVPNRAVITARTVRPCLRLPIMVPKVRVNATGMSRIARISTMLLIGVGFSNGWAEFAARMPPPLVPSSLIASCDATGGASAVVSACPSSPVAVKLLRYDWITPWLSRISAITNARGSRIRRVPRTRSTQKLPISPPRPTRTRPRIRATATPIPTAADTKFCTASPRGLGEVAHRRLGGRRTASWCWRRTRSRC